MMKYEILNSILERIHLDLRDKNYPYRIKIPRNFDNEILKEFLMEIDNYYLTFYPIDRSKLDENFVVQELCFNDIIMNKLSILPKENTNDEIKNFIIKKDKYYLPIYKDKKYLEKNSSLLLLQEIFEKIDYINKEDYERYDDFKRYMNIYSAQNKN